jgi:phosphatidylinositol-bisphosphatase
LDKVKDRNDDFHTIFNNSVFAPPQSSGMVRGEEEHSLELVRPKHGAEKSQGHALSIKEHDFVFWLGDLNYRIGGVDKNLVFAKVKEAEFHDPTNTSSVARNFLLNNDQLNIERMAGHVFEGFDEMQITFAPTYKFEPMTDRYDQREGKKVRAPAWCDRILWRCLDDSPDVCTPICYDYLSNFPVPNFMDYQPPGALVAS